MIRKKALLSWSSGKDSAWSLHVVRQQNEYDVVGLVTTINELHSRVAMHAVRVELLEMQADAAGIPLWKVPIPYPCSNEQYEAAVSKVIERAAREQVSSFIFGDLFLADIRQYRESRLAGTGIAPVFPIWGIPTDQLAMEMIAAGLKAFITGLMPPQLPKSFGGRIFDAALVHDLPPSVDPCGERGEFHSFAYEGQMFHRKFAFTPGEIVERDNFVFADLLPKR